MHQSGRSESGRLFSGPLLLAIVYIQYKEMGMMQPRQSGRQQEGLSSWLTRVVKEFCATSPENTLNHGTGERAWEEPLVGFSNGADPLYLRIKRGYRPLLPHPHGDLPTSLS
jgi:hypothetical protein